MAVKVIEREGGGFCAAFIALRKVGGVRSGGMEDWVRRELASHTSRHLPLYARPARYVFMENLPLTIAGKVDYESLDVVTSGNMDRPSESGDDVDRDLVAIWCQVLKWTL